MEDKTTEGFRGKTVTTCFDKKKKQLVLWRDATISTFVQKSRRVKARSW